MVTTKNELLARAASLFKHTQLPTSRLGSTRSLRITAVNQFDGGPVPRFYLLRSGHTTIWRARADQSPSLVDKLAATVAREEEAMQSGAHQSAKAGSWRAPLPEQHPAFTQLLTNSVYNPVLYAGPVFSFPNQLPRNPKVVTQLVSHQNQHQLQAYMADWLPDVAYRAPMVGALVDNQIVAVCASVRISSNLAEPSQKPNQTKSTRAPVPAIHEAGVATAPEFRQRGFAAAVVAEWVNRVQQLGARPYYSTQWSNTASQQVAARLNLEWVATEYHLT